jgi:predicted dehydrogenase
VNDMDEIRIGVVGLGFGQFHVHTLANMAGVRLTAVADLKAEFPGGLEAYAARYGARAYRQAEEMIEKENLDAVSICTSPKYRESVITAAGRKGLAMFVEKPWAANLHQARALASICEQNHAKVMVGFSFRFHPVVMRLRQLMDTELGAGWMLCGEYVFGWLPSKDHWLWEADNGNGFFNENSCHLFDVVCHLMGEPESLTAEGINPMNSPSESGAVMTLRFASGGVAALMVGGLGAGGYNHYPRLSLVSANGQALMQGREHYWEELTWNRRGEGITHTLNAPPETLQNMRYTHAFQHFFACLRSDTQPTATIADGIRSVAIAEAMYRSMQTGQKVTLNC